MADNRKVSLYIKDENVAEFERYRSSQLQWGLSEVGFQLAYLLEMHLGKLNKDIDNDSHITSIVETLKKLTDECPGHDFDIIKEGTSYFFSFSDVNILNLAVRNVNYCIRKINEETQFRLLRIIGKMSMKSSTETQKRSAVLDVPEPLWKSAINKNDVTLMNGIMPFIARYDKDKMFKWSLLCGSIAIANNMIDLDQKDGRVEYQRWLEKWGAWPLCESNKNESEIYSSEYYNYHLVTLAQAIAQHFSIEEESSEFNLLFPFSNEDNYKKVLDKISILNKLENIGAIEAKNKNKIGVCLLFGESHFLSLLSIIKQRANIVVLADVVRKQWIHIEHMLTALDQSETPKEFIQSYLKGNPILNEQVGEKEIHVTADINYLTRNIKNGGSLEEYNFLSTPEKFKACKQAAKELIFVQVKLDLLDEQKCQQLDALLSRHHAAITLCNLTNIHDYDNENKLCKSVALLLQSSPHCLVMGSTHTGEHDLETHVFQGMEKYFHSCLETSFTPVKTIYAMTADQSCNEKNDSTAVSETINEPMFGVGMFNSKTPSLRLISSNGNKLTIEKKLTL